MIGMANYLKQKFMRCFRLLSLAFDSLVKDQEVTLMINGSLLSKTDFWQMEQRNISLLKSFYSGQNKILIYEF